MYLYTDNNMLTKRYHWIFDASNVPKKSTTSSARVQKALKDLTKLCSMTIVSGPHVLKGIPENPGVTGICVVDFSHISIHTFSNPQEICVDIFSCKPFDPKKIQAYLMKTFDVNVKNFVYFEVKYPNEKR